MTNANVCGEEIINKLRESGELERIALSDESIFNAVINRYLDDLAGASHVPSVRGYTALGAIPKPRTLEDAKRIVDGK